MTTFSYNPVLRRLGCLIVLTGLLFDLLADISPTQAAAPARTTSYAEAICNSDPNVFFCEDFEGNDIKITNSVGSSGKFWNNPALSSVDLYWTTGGTKQQSTQPLSGFSTNNRVYRITKSTSFTDIDTGVNAGTGDGTLKGTLKSGLAGTGAREWYARMQIWLSSDTIFPQEYDMKLFFAQPTNCVDNPSCTYQTGINFMQDFFCSGVGNFNDVPTIRYGVPYEYWPIYNEYCPPLTPGQAPDGSRAPRLQKGRWYTLEYHVKLSTSSSSNDGMLELWVDGVKAFSRTLNTCKGGCPDMGTIMILNWMHSSSPADPQGGYVEYDNIVMSRQYIGPPNGSTTTSPPATPPIAPANLSVH